LIEEIHRLAAYLLAEGLTKTSVVGLYITNEIEHLMTTLSLMHLEIPHIVLPSFESPEAHTDIIHRLNITHILKDSTGVEGFSFDVHTLVENNAHTKSFDDVIMFLKTSGTTGQPKIIPFSKEQIEHQAYAYKWFEEEQLMTFASIEHNNARRHRIFCIFAGGTNVFLEHHHDILTAVAKHHITLISGSHLHAANLLKIELLQPLSNTKLFFSGSKIPSSMLSKISETVSPHIIIGYGSTETGAISFAKIEKDQDNEPIGNIVDGTDIQIVDSDNHPLTDEAIGEIKVRSKGMATYYLDNPAESMKRFNDRWFFTGDIGFKNRDGQLVVKNRKDDMMILNGINIFPSEIEEVLESHEDIIASAVVSIESANHGSIPVAAIEIKKNASCDPQKYMLYAKQKLMLRAPRKILIVESLPRNAQGKIQKENVKFLFQKK
jgi:acyl-coenzyme A synthetase/AMP-(fatty) acid ligase